MRVLGTISMLSFALASCIEPKASLSASDLDVGYFECQIQPIFDRSCAFTACHGDPGRALFTYSMSKRRIVDLELIGEVLTDKELCWNFYRASSFATADPEASQLITKPATLGSEGSQYHEGNYLFGALDSETRCLTSWMGGARQAVGTSTPSEACVHTWQIRLDGTPARCTPRSVDCPRAIEGPDLPEVGP